MDNRYLNKLLASGLLLGALNLTAGAASAAEYWLCAGAATMTMPDTGEEVTVWGFAQDDDADLNNGCGTGTVQVPGPALTVPPGDNSLEIHLRNDLPPLNGSVEPISLVIPGQITAMTPVYFTDGQGRDRVRSFTHETGPGSVGTYTWSNFKPGTYAYHSGTHPQVQVQMGLYGSVVKNFAAGQAYPDVPYDNEVMLFYSEIDPALHASVSDGTYGTTGPSSTFDYVPRYFLVNGTPYETGNTPAIPAGSVGQRTLLRFVNMGLKTHVPLVQGVHLELIAEDGNLYPYPREQYSVMLAAAKTRDAVLVAESEGNFPIYDRALSLTNGIGVQGGLMSFLQVGASTSTLAAMADNYTATEDEPLAVAAANGVLANDSPSTGVTAVPVSDPASGILVLNADGSFTYTPSADFNGTDGFSYKTYDGSTYSNVALVNLTIDPVNDAPTAANDAYETNQDEALNVTSPGVLGNDVDAEGSSLSAATASVPTNGSLALNGDGSFLYTPDPGYSGADSFTYVANDGSVDSTPATVSITVNAVAPNTAPVAVDDNASTQRNTFVDVDVLANDTDAEGNIDPTTVTITVQPNKGGSVSVDPNTGIVRYTPRFLFRGSEVFKYTVKDSGAPPAESNEARVRVNVTR